MADLYYYELLLPSGQTRRGMTELSADVESERRRQLEAQAEGSLLVRCVRLCSTRSVLAPLLSRLIRGRVPQEEVGALLRDVAVMVQSGVPVFDAVRDVHEDRRLDGSRAVQAVCAQLERDLIAGASFGQAVARQPDVFSDTVRSLVSIGDETGDLGLMLTEAAAHLERLGRLKASSLQALIYPLFSLLAVLGAGAFWIVYVMPKLADMFRQFNAKLPPLTVAVLGTAGWLAKHWTLILMLLICLVVAAVLAWRYSEAVRLQVFRLMHRLPLVKRVVGASAYAMWCEHLSLLLRSGVDVMKSLGLLEIATVDRYVRHQVGQMRQLVERGDGLASAMRSTGGFPTLMVRMIEVGERSGTLDAQLAHLARLYSERLHQLMANLGEIFKPLVIMLVGGFFALLVVALMLPVYDLIRQTMGGVR